MADIASTVAGMLGVTPDGLVQALTKITSVTCGETIIKDRTEAEAKDTRNNMAKSLYRRLFSWLVTKVNLSLCPSKQTATSISVVDPCGTENVAQNSIEQASVMRLILHWLTRFCSW